MGTGIAFAGRMFGRIADLLRQAVVARLVSETEFGIYALAITIFRMLMMIAPFGLTMAVVRFAAPDLDHPERLAKTLRTGMALIWVMGGLFGALLFASADLLANAVFQTPGLIPLLHGFAFALVFSTVMRLALALTALRRQVGFLVFVEEVFQPGLYLIAIVALTLLGVDPMVGVIVGAPITFALGMALALWRVRRQFPSIADRAIPIAPGLMLRLLRFGSPLALASLFLWSTPLIDRLLLGVFASVEETGVYVVVAQVATFFTLIGVAVETIQSPMLATLMHERNTERIQHVISSSVRLGLILGIPALAVLVHNSGDLLAIVFGDSFAVGGASLLILSGALVLRVISDRAIAVLVLSGHNRQWLAYSTVSFVVNLILDLLLIPPLGMIGAALSTVVVNLFLLIALRQALWARFRIHLFNRAIAIALAIMLVSVGAGLLPTLLNWTLPRLPAVVVTSMISGGVCLLLLWRLILTDEERSLLADLLRRKTRS